MKEQKPGPEWVRQLGLLSVIVTEIVAYTGAGVFIGYLVHSKLGGPAWLIAVLAAIGLGLAIYRVYLAFKKLQK